MEKESDCYGEDNWKCGRPPGAEGFVFYRRARSCESEGKNLGVPGRITGKCSNYKDRRKVSKQQQKKLGSLGQVTRNTKKTTNEIVATKLINCKFLYKFRENHDFKTIDINK